MGFPPELITFFSAMLPFTELRGSIPLALEVFKLSPLSALAFSVAGNIVPVFLLLAFLNPVSKFLMKHSPFFNKFLTKLFEKTRRKHSKSFKEIGAIFLVTFVAIPLPVTGAWTGSLIAFLFEVPYLIGAGLISLGVLIAGILVTLGVETISEVIEKIIGLF